MQLKAGLITDTNELRQPNGSWRKALNLYWNKSNLLENEAGFDQFSLGGDFHLIGVIETAKLAVLFVYTPTQSIICTVDDTGLLTYKFVLTSNSDNDLYLRFNLDYPIEGVYFYNYKRELVVSWTDEFNKPCIINLDSIPVSIDNNKLFIGTANTLARLHLQFEYLTPVLCQLRSEDGGNLKRGTYTVYYRFGLNELELGNYLLCTDVVTLTGIKDPINKTVVIGTVGGTTYLVVNVVLCFKDFTNGIYFYDLGIKNIAEGGFSIDSLDGRVTTDTAQILVPNTLFRKIGSLTTLNHRLVAARLTTDPEIDYTSYANDIVVKWFSQAPASQPFPNEDDSAYVYNTRTWRHGEVYALYVGWQLNDGTLTRPCLIPGPDPTGWDTVSDLGYYHYQIDDTCKLDVIGDFAGIGGLTGYWYNPDEDVTHHKMPSIDYIRNNVQTSSDYGAAWLDTINLVFLNVVTPTELIGKVKQPVFYAAVKEAGNCLIQGQGLLQWTARHQSDSSTAPSGIWSTGGNWALDNYAAGNNNQILLYKSCCRLNSFEMLFDKPTLNVNVLKNELKLTITGTTLIGNNSDSHRYAQSDFTEAVSAVTVSSKRVRSITKSYYLPTNTSFSNFKNDYCEESIIIQDNGSTGFSDLPMSTGMWTDTMPQEITYLSSLLKVVRNLHIDYKNQSLWICGMGLSSDTTSNIIHGDCFNGEYVYVTLAPADGDDLPVPVTSLSTGTRVIRKHVVSSRFNLSALKHYNITNHNAVPPLPIFTLNSISYLKQIDPFSPFERIYSYSYNSILNLGVPVPYNPAVQFINSFPNRIARSVIQASESKGLTWRTFLPNEYYELQKEKGAIIKVQGLDNLLLIQTIYSTFPAIIKDTLATQNVEVYLGQADIFDRDPDELLYTPLGYAGNQHQFGTCNCKHGFVWCDANSGKVFIFQKSLQEISNRGTSNMLKAYLALVTTINPFVTRTNAITIGFNELTNTLHFRIGNNMLSYSMDIEDGRWVSEHSYRPNFLFATNKSLFEYVRDLSNITSYLYKFNSTVKKAIFDRYVTGVLVTEFSLLEVIFNIHEKVSKIWGNINWKTKLSVFTFGLIPIGTVIYDKTFTDVTTYNDGQCSPKIPLTKQVGIVKADISTFDQPVNPNEINGVTLRENGLQQMINKLAPCNIIDPSVLSLSEQLSRSTDGQWNFNGFVDMVLNMYKGFDKYNPETDTNIANWLKRTDRKIWVKPSPLREKSPYHIQDFISEYLGVILRYDNIDQLKFELFELGVNAQVTSRGMEQDKLDISK